MRMVDFIRGLFRPGHGRHVRVETDAWTQQVYRP